MREIAFTLGFALESLNVRDRKNHWERSRDKGDLSLQVLAAIGGPAHKPFPPWRKVRVTVVRCSPGRLDDDNNSASAKPLLDVLCVRSPRHPTGLGIIQDDGPDFLTLVSKQTVVKRGESATVVRIECLD